MTGSEFIQVVDGQKRRFSASWRITHTIAQLRYIAILSNKLFELIVIGAIIFFAFLVGMRTL